MTRILKDCKNPKNFVVHMYVHEVKIHTFSMVLKRRDRKKVPKYVIDRKIKINSIYLY